MGKAYGIRDLATEFSVTSRTLRHYEAEGLIAPERRGQARVYSARDRARISLILRGRRVGFSLAEIGEILDLYDAGDGGVLQLTRAHEKFSERIAVLERQRADIDESIAELKLGLTMIDNKLAERQPPKTPRVRVTSYGVMPADD